MKITIYQLPLMTAYQNIIKDVNKENIDAIEVGYIELEEFDRDECWHLGNWTAWADERPTNLHYEGRSFSSDVILFDPSENKYHYALPFGWYQANTLQDILDYLKTYQFGQELKAGLIKANH